MSSRESVTEWLEKLRAGDSLAAQELWDRYVAQLVRLAHKHLRTVPRRVADTDDVVVSAFGSFYEAVKANRFSRVDDRDDLWQVLVMLTERKAVDQIRHLRAKKRGGCAARGESALDGSCSSSPAGGLAQVPDREATPAFAVMAADQFKRLLDALGNEELRRIALDKMAGYTNDEIAHRLGTALRNVERRLNLIRRIWREGLQQ
jgi:RNA polymerase sigma factor (sigma-70 family)